MESIKQYLKFEKPYILSIIATVLIGVLRFAFSFVFFILLRPPVEYYRQYFAQLTASKILYDIRDKLFDHIQRLSLKYYANTKTGEIISRVIHDVEQTKAFVVTGLMNVWLDLVT